MDIAYLLLSHRPFRGGMIRDFRLNAEAEGHTIRVAGVVTVGVTRAVHKAETGGVVAIRRTLPPPIPLTVLLALPVLGILLTIPVIPLA